MSLSVIDKQHEDYSGILERFRDVSPIYGLCGKILEYDGLDDLLQKTDLDWEVLQVPVYYEIDNYRPAPGYVANIRSDNYQLLGIVGKRYHVMNNRELLDYVVYISSEFELQVEYAYGLRGGKRIFAFCRYPSFVKMNEIEYWGKVLCFTTSHDGTRSISLTPIAVRLFDGSTYSLCSSRVLSTKHTRRCASALKVFRKILTQFEADFNEFMSNGRKLLQASYSGSDLIWFLNELFPPPKEGSKASKTRYENRIDTIRHIIRKLEVGSVRGTWWVLFNAVCAYVDFHVKGRGKYAKENRVVDAISGPGRDLKAKALTLALSKVEVDI